MIDLPVALRPWRAQLELFPPELATSLAPWIPRLALALGPLSSKTEHQSGEPDGFGGISRRGTWDRLLLSEWALALEHPEEFTRRAAMGEHAFLELARKEPGGSRRSAVLFDAGPSQLGSPRIAQLALLVVLARRAALGGADFTWGILGQPEGWSYEQLSEPSVLGLLEARSSEEPASADLDDWLKRLRVTREPDDLWVVGSARVAAFTAERRLSRVVLHDVLEPGVRRVRVIVARRAAPRAELELDLPDERAAVRLVRDPFRVTQSAPIARLRGNIGAGHLLYSRDGRKLFVRSGASVVIMHHPAQDPRGQAGLARTLAAGDDRVIAAGLVGRDPFLVTVDPEGTSLGIRSYTRRGRLYSSTKGPALPRDLTVWQPGAATPLQPAFLRYGANLPEQGVVFTDAGGNLFYLRTQDPKELLDLGAGVAAIGSVRRRVQILGQRSLTPPGAREAEERGFASELGEGGVPRMIAPQLTNLAPIVEAFFGFPAAVAHPDLGLAAVLPRGGYWHTVDAHGLHAVDVPPGYAVVGVMGRDTPTAKSGLVVLGEGRRRFLWRAEDEVSPLVRAERPVVAAAVSPARRHLAWLDERGELHVWSADANAKVHHLTPDGTAEGGGLEAPDEGGEA